VPKIFVARWLAVEPGLRWVVAWVYLNCIGLVGVIMPGGVGRRDKAVRSFRLRLHSGLRQSGRVLFYRVGNLGLRPRLVYVGLSALGCGGLANGEAKQIP